MVPREECATAARGVDKFFKTLTTLESTEEFSLAKSENLGSGEEGSKNFFLFFTRQV
jgi:hypothetical protein